MYIKFSKKSILFSTFCLINLNISSIVTLQSPDGITENDIKTFCKNASFIRLMRTRSLEQEYTVETSKVPELGKTNTSTRSVVLDYAISSCYINAVFHLPKICWWHSFRPNIISRSYLDL